ncbi:MAG: hypothetical protein KJO09_06590 [Gammaproteobacteria bacterium]|nr:hypothetical protein [Gammaproteobacteria bacterium]
MQRSYHGDFSLIGLDAVVSVDMQNGKRPNGHCGPGFLDHPASLSRGEANFDDLDRQGSDAFLR